MAARNWLDQTDGGHRDGQRRGRALRIARASPRLIGIALAGFDYVMDMQTERGDGTELYYARCAVLHAARAAGSTPLTWFFRRQRRGRISFKEVELIKRLGFTANR